MRAHVPALILAALALASCGDGEDPSEGFFSAQEFPLTFEYPADWAERDQVSLSSASSIAGRAVGSHT